MRNCSRGEQVRLGRLHDEMIVVVHQDEHMQSPTIGLHRTSQPVQSFLPIRIISHNRTPLVAARRHVMVGTWVFHPQRSSHNG